MFSPNLTLEESDGNESFVERNGDKLLKVTNVKSGDVLKDILTELKINNFHLSLITEGKIDEINI